MRKLNHMQSAEHSDVAKPRLRFLNSTCAQFVVWGASFTMLIPCLTGLDMIDVVMPNCERTINIYTWIKFITL
jgi:hypothetical protein